MAGRQDHRGHHHHRHRTIARLWRHVGWLPQVDPDRIWAVHRVRRVEFLPVVLLVWRRGGGLRVAKIQGLEAPVHRALTEPILMGGAPRSIAILNGTLAAALGIGLRLWLAGLLLWFVGHMAAVWAAKRDPDFVEVVRRHLRIPGHLNT